MTGSPIGGAAPPPVPSIQEAEPMTSVDHDDANDPIDLTGATARLDELRIQNLGVIESLSLVLPGGSIAVTGETGAGKTMVVGAIQLLMGGRADPDMVRVGADEAVIEGRIVIDDGREIIARRVIASAGRSRAYLNGSLATATALAETVGPMIDVHGQHDQQSLLQPATQRSALDRFAKIDTEPLRLARTSIAAIDAAIADLGGDATERARQIDLLSYQLRELDDAEIDDPAEDDELRASEDRLASAFEDRTAAAQLTELLGSDGALAEAIASAASIADESSVFAELASRLTVVQDEVADLASTARTLSEEITDDPESREAVRARRQLLAEMRRKYGPSIVDVIAFREDLRSRLDDLQSHDARSLELDRRREVAHAELVAAETAICAERTAAAAPLAHAIETELQKLAMPRARVDVAVAGPAGDDVQLLLAANPGLAAVPVGKGASGGELSRTMLALRLVVSGGPPIKVFDEVDAGIGGETARAVGEALSTVGGRGQTFVVTHLAQVAAMADTHIVIAKSSDASDTVSQVRVLDDDERIVEVSRMLSGSPDSGAAREHAQELLSSTQGR